MKIGIVGIPGSGKSAVAEKLIDHFNLNLVDGYVEDLQTRVGWSLGHHANHVCNLLVATERLKVEREYEACGGYVSCGTIVDSLAYAAGWAVKIQEHYGDNINDSLRTGSVMGSLALICAETTDYDFVFLMPKGAKISEENDRLDHSMREALYLLEMDHTVLDQEDKFAQAMEVINAATPASE